MEKYLKTSIKDGFYKTVLITLTSKTVLYETLFYFLKMPLYHLLHRFFITDVDMAMWKHFFLVMSLIEINYFSLEPYKKRLEMKLYQFSNPGNPNQWP